MMSQNEVLQLNYSQPRSRHRSLCILTLSGGSLYPENPGRLLESGELVVVLVTAAPRTAQHPANYIYVAKTSLECYSFVQK